MPSSEIDIILNEIKNLSVQIVQLKEDLVDYVDKQNADRKENARLEHNLIREDISKLEATVYGKNGSDGLTKTVGVLEKELSKRTTLILIIEALTAIGAGVLIIFVSQG